MKLELPDNNASVLFHMGNALQSIARDIDTSLPVNGHKITHTETVGDVSHSVTVEPLVKLSDVERYGQAGKEHYESIKDDELSDAIDNMTDAIAAEHEIPVNRLLGESDTIDADGLPWDQRIHSRGKTRLADNTWRMARKPSEKTDEEWAEYVEDIKTELKALMAIPVAVTYDPNEAPEVVTPPVVIEAPEVVTPPVVIEAPEVVTPPVVDAVVTPPVVDAVDATLMVRPTFEEAVEARGESVKAYVDAVDGLINKINATPPVIATPAVTTGPTTFPELMKFITVNNKKLTKESVDEALKAQGLASIALLAARADLIPQVHAALVKLL